MTMHREASWLIVRAEVTNLMCRATVEAQNGPLAAERLATIADEATDRIIAAVKKPKA